MFHHGDNPTLLFSHFVRGFFHGLLKAREQQQHKRRDRDGDQREIPIEPEHDDEHRDDGEDIHQNAQRGRGGEGLNGLHISRDGAEQRPGLVRIVVTQRELLQMLICAHTQIVSDPLAHAGGVIVRKIGGDSADYRDHHHSHGGGRRYLHFAGPAQQRFQQMVQPMRKLVAAHDIVQNNFQRPRACDACRGLQQHPRQDDDQNCPNTVEPSS